MLCDAVVWWPPAFLAARRPSTPIPLPSLLPPSHAPPSPLPLLLSSSPLRPLLPSASTRTGLAVEALQDQLPNGRVLYSSATGASEPDNLRYMSRLGAFGYRHIGNMIDVLKK